ncbi:lysine decarboxylase-like protein [Penicillium citrinum]|uniref:Lysine decarboxylase-like protein n=1 Tax=Penicillium citrinum TaxID=5077 RepID=A0A9W9TT14_PENCI|nr:lysine decarboxylase-like protein [Penicillium citrinum]KAJ5240340.1 lysine decarboxylase-like protein [Penicillium citrinum]
MVDTAKIVQPVICVFCGAQPGASPEYVTAARELASQLHKANAKLIYGGGTRGLMGEIAREMVSLSGPTAVQGFIPEALIAKHPEANVSSAQNSKQAERQISEVDSQNNFGNITIVSGMHTRGPGSGFVAMPGGYGTLEEVAEMITWNQLGIHDKGIVILNINGFWDGVLAWFAKAVEQKFVGQGNKGIAVECTDVREVLNTLKMYKLGEGRLNLVWNQI